MSNNKNQRGRSGQGQNQNQQRRRRGRPQQQQQQAPKGPAMTALGESTYEAVFDHGGEGYGVWFDGAVREDPNYKQFWKGTGMRPIFVRIDEDRILITKELDRDLPGLRDQGDSADEQHDNRGNRGDSSDDSSESGDAVYTPEEAARLFGNVDEPESAPDAGAASDEADSPVAEAAAAPAAEDADEAEEAPAPAPKRRTTRRRTTKAAAEDAASDD
jgi:hypothetical protein